MTATAAELRGGRLPVITAITGTILIAVGAFWLSFIALKDLARRSGIEAGQAWAWPLIVDGIIVVATVAAVALAGHRAAWYPWLLLMCGAGLSVTANGVHAVIAADTDVPAFLAAAVAAVPPLVLLAITHLTVILTRHRSITSEATETPVVLPEAESHLTQLSIPAAAAPNAQPLPLAEPAPTVQREAPSGRVVADVLRADGWSNKKIARHLGVHPSTIGRWFAQDPTTAPELAAPSAGLPTAHVVFEEEETHA